MSGHKNTGILISFVLAVGLLSASFTAVLMTSHYNRAQFQLLNGICRSIIDELPEAETVIPAILKDYKNKTAVPEEKKHTGRLRVPAVRLFKSRPQLWNNLCRCRISFRWRTVSGRLPAYASKRNAAD